MAATGNPDMLWLIRTEENWIMRPISKSEVIERLNRLEIKLNDEICAGNGYWFYIHEKEEVFKNLGVYPPTALWRGQRSEDEITDTETQTMGDTATEISERNSGLSPSASVNADFEGDSSTRMMDVPALEKTPEDPVRQQAKSFRTLRPGTMPVSTGGAAASAPTRNPGNNKVPLRQFEPEHNPAAVRRNRSSRNVSPLARGDSHAPNQVVEGPKIWSTLAGILIGVLIGLIYLIARRLGD